MFLPRNHLQMSSCLSGGGRAYAFEFEIVKSPSTSTTRNSNTSSSPPSSTISESSNTGLAITTRKPRTPRKRPNQTYNEAAALLSTAYPNLFSTKNLAVNPRKFTKSPYNDSFSLGESAELLLPFRVIELDDSSCFLLHHHQPPMAESIKPKSSGASDTKSCQSPGEFDSRPNSNFGDSESMDLCESSNFAYPEIDDFDAESILDEEIEEGGIDSIMGNLRVEAEADADAEESNGGGYCYGYPMGLGFGSRFEFGMGVGRGGIRALRHVDEGNWWSFPAVDMVDLSPKFRKPPATATEKKKKKKKVEKEKSLAEVEAKSSELLAKGNPKPHHASGLSLKLNFDDVLNAWSNKGSPFSEDAPGSDAPENDVNARLAEIDLFSETSGVREASVLRYKEKRRTRLFSKKIRYQVRKVNADRRPRMKGRFVRRPNSKHE